jgi:flagellar biosynthesis GTPase FlhF
MGIQSVTELVINPGVPPRPELAHEFTKDIDLVGGTSKPPVQWERVRSEIERIERLIRSVESAEAKLRSFDTGYPLNEALIAGGVSDGSLRLLQNSYEENVPTAIRGEPDSARLHLLDYLKCASTRSFADISGPHVFLGSAGAGKTSLMIKLAAELAREGKTVAIVVAAPYHSGEIRRVEEAAAALMIDAVVANDYEELMRALRLYEDKDAVLIDTPCMLSRRHGAVTAMFEKLRSASNLFKHMVCSITNDADLLFSELDLYHAWDCDFLALSRIDLARKCGKIIEIVLHRDVTFSFVGFEEGDGPGIRLATPEMLLELVSPSVDAEVSKDGGP